MMNFNWKHSKDGNADCFSVRKKVFVLEQGFSEGNEFDETDDIALHLCVTKDGEPIAAARLFKEGEHYHCGRICILKEYRKSGVGRLIMEQLERKTMELGGTVLALSAQLAVSDFYKKCGYVPMGDVYLDEHCPHIKCVKALAVLSE